MGSKAISKSTVLLLQFILISFQFQDALCHPGKTSSNDGITHSSDAEAIPAELTIFDSRVLDRVKTLFTRSLQATKATSKNGQKKSIITTAHVENSLHLKIDPRQFGNALLTQANENAARKSDIYMNKAIDATALGAAVLKLIFGKDAKMVMKDSTSAEDAKASLRASEPRPTITLWSHSKSETAERKSLVHDKTIKSKNKLGKLSMNILKLVKSIPPEAGTENGETKSATDNSGSSNFVSRNDDQRLSGSDSNLQKLLSIMEDSKGQENGDKKSWVLLKVPSKQPEDELGMLNDPVATEENSDDEGSQQEHTGKSHRKHRVTKSRKHHKHPEITNPKEDRKLITTIQGQVKHLAELVNDKKSKKVESFTGTKHEKLPKTSSYEGKSFTVSAGLASKSLKTEPFHEVDAIKTDTTAHASYENSVHNLLRALESSAQKHSPSHVLGHVKKGSHIRSGHRKVELVPLKKKEEHASSKDELAGTNPPGGAVVSLDALRQLGQLLGLSSQQNEKRISPYTGTQDTLTLATASPPESVQGIQNPTPTPPPIPPTVPAVPATTSSLNRISEQLKMFAERGLRGHNDYRRLHHAAPLKWSEDLASMAEKLAYQAAKQGTSRRSVLVENKGYGENVAKIPNVKLENAGEEATRHWYNEKQKFTFTDPVIDESTKAFTQMIWKGTQTLGMGAAKDDDTGELYVVALYSPKGNEQATLRENLSQDGKKNNDVYASIFKKSYTARHE